MMTMALIMLVLLFLSAGFGIWIVVTGSPYNSILFNIHKLTSIAFGLLSALTFINHVKDTGMQSIDIVLAVLFILSMAALLVSGAIMSIKQPTAWLRSMHIPASVLKYIGGGFQLVKYLIG